MRGLEAAYDVALFVRANGGAELTPLGRRLYERTAALRDTEREAAEILHAAKSLETGELSVIAGAPGPAMRLLSDYRKSYPGIRVRIEFGNWRQVVARIRDRSAEVGILTEAPQTDEFLTEPVVSQRIVALVPIEDPLARRAEISLRDLSDRTVLFRTNDSLTQRTVNDRLSRLGLTLQPLMTLEAREAIYEACAQGLGVGFMFDAASTRADGVARVRIAELSESYPEHVFCLSAVSRLRTVRAFFDLAMRLRP